MNPFMVGVTLFVSAAAAADEGALAILRNARDAAAGMAPVAPRDLPAPARLWPQERGAEFARDHDGWPILARHPSEPPVYERRPARPLPEHPQIDVNELNRRLAAAGVAAAIYQLVPERAERLLRPQGDYVVVFKNGNYGGVPFEDFRYWESNRYWRQVVDIRVIGSVLVAENEDGVRYVDLAPGFVNDAFPSAARVEFLIDCLQVWFSSLADPIASRLVLADVLARVGIQPGARTATIVRFMEMRKFRKDPRTLAPDFVKGCVSREDPSVADLMAVVDGRAYPLRAPGAK